jgi:hypothetical protein
MFGLFGYPIPTKTVETGWCLAWVLDPVTKKFYVKLLSVEDAKGLERVTI